VAVVALLIHPSRPEAATSAKELAEGLVRSGHEVVVPRDGSSEAGLDAHEVADAVLAGRADLGVSLGGDGSMLHAVRLLADAGVPVLGVNFGSLGYLTQIDPDDAAAAIDRWLAGDFAIETRMRVSVVMPDGAVACALNEIVVEKIDSGRTIRVAVSIDHESFHTYEADGVIVASPTGSTAYSLSARGPLVDPTHEALILTPVAPHTLFDRSMVLSPNSEIGLSIEGNRAADVAVDGRVIGRLEQGEQATCLAAAEPARLVTFGDRNFHQIIKSKFDLNSR
jgi:NAD+ kinase